MVDKLQIKYLIHWTIKHKEAKLTPKHQCDYGVFVSRIYHSYLSVLYIVHG